MARGTSSNQLVGAAGEHHVAAELFRRGWKATLTYRNIERTDLLAEHAESGHKIAVQSKAKRGQSWRVGGAVPEPSPAGASEWFVFTDLPAPGEPPVSYVVPRDHVSAVVHVGARAWENSPGRGGRKRNPVTQYMVNVPDIEDYREEWVLLNEPAQRAPWLLPEWV